MMNCNRLQRRKNAVYSILQSPRAPAQELCEVDLTQVFQFSECFGKVANFTYLNVPLTICGLFGEPRNSIVAVSHATRCESVRRRLRVVGDNLSPTTHPTANKLIIDSGRRPGEGLQMSRRLKLSLCG